MFTVTTYNGDGEKLGTMYYDTPEAVTRRLLEEKGRVHRLSNLGRRWEVNGPDCQGVDSNDWLYSRPTAELTECE